jgi:penicillin G amidase
MAGFAIGYLHAADRLWQFDFMRRFALGRLSEVLGEVAIPLDESMRLLMIRETCEHALEAHQEPEAQKYLEAYLKGIKEYVKRNPLPIQYHILWSEFDDYESIDICAIGKLMFFSMTHNWGIEVVRDYILALTKDEEFMQDMFGFDPDHFDEIPTYVINDLELQEIGFFMNDTKMEDLKPRVTNINKFAIQEIKKGLEVVEGVQSVGGSNNWIISGDYTKSGKPIFVNDPHLNNGMPSVWYLSHVEYTNGSFIFGATIPGIPAFSIFATEHVAVGVTSIF